MSKKILDLGCGWAKQAGAIGVDRAQLSTVDVVADISSFPLPFKSDLFDEIYLNDVIEHIPDTMGLMEELFRIAAPSANVYIRVINWNSEYNAMDPTHVRQFHEKTFNFFGEYKDRLHYSKARFKVMEVKKGYSERAKKLFRGHVRLMEIASYYLNNILEDLNFTLVAEKPTIAKKFEREGHELFNILACPACLGNKFLSSDSANAGFLRHGDRWLECANHCGLKFPVFDGVPFVTPDIGRQFCATTLDNLPDGPTPTAFKRISKEEF